MDFKKKQPFSAEAVLLAFNFQCRKDEKSVGFTTVIFNVHISFFLDKPKNPFFEVVPLGVYGGIDERNLSAFI